jgi:glycosyltransferase involved in cell wall biosynthesis
MASVTVVIPTFNRCEFVTNAVESVLSQTHQDREVIVVDDGSTDGTGAVLAQYGTALHYLYQPNRGVSAARNAGIMAAAGEWVAFLDSDDEWHRDYLAQQMEQVHRYPNLSMQTTDCRFIGLDGDVRTYFYINGSWRAFKDRDYLLLRQPFSFVIRHGPWQIGATIIRRRALERAGLFDTNLTLSEDHDLMARVALDGSFGMIRQPLVTIYRRAESIDSLTTRATQTPINARASNGRMYEKLQKLPGLTPSERRVLNAVASANSRAIGNLLAARGDTAEADAHFRHAFFTHPSVRSLGKYVLFRLLAVSS